MLKQHKIGYRLAKRRCGVEIAKAFPQWLMEISLLLQVSENVNAAVANSVREAPAILTDGLRKMQDQIMQNPESNEPYMNFMKEFGILEIQSAMGMLYSISSGRGGDAAAPLRNISADAMLAFLQTVICRAARSAKQKENLLKLRFQQGLFFYFL